jgi:hypothetical protein
MSYFDGALASTRPAIPSSQELFPHRGLVPSRPPAFAPKGSLDGWPRCKTMTLEGMAGPARIRAEASHCAKIGHFYFATTWFFLN